MTSNWWFIVKLFQNKMSWSIAGSDEQKNMQCNSCEVACDDLVWAEHLFEEVPEKKTYIFGHESAQTQSFTTSTDFGASGGS